MLNSNISPICPHTMVDFGPLTAEIGSVVWGTPPNVNWFRILAALLHDTVVVGVSQTAALNRGHHLYPAGRPSRLALAHILVWYCIVFYMCFSSISVAVLPFVGYLKRNENERGECEWLKCYGRSFQRLQRGRDPIAFINVMTWIYRRAV